MLLFYSQYEACRFDSVKHNSVAIKTSNLADDLPSRFISIAISEFGYRETNVCNLWPTIN